MMSHTPKLLLLLLPVLVAATFPLSCEECIRILVLDKKLDVEPDLDATQTQVRVIIATPPKCFPPKHYNYNN